MLDYFGDNVNEYGGADAKVEWVANRKVVIRFDGQAEAAKRETKLKGIEIAYEETR